MQGQRPIRRRHVEALEDVECLPHGRAAARRRRHAVDVVAAVGHVRRVARLGRVAREIGRRHQAGPHGEAELGVGCDRRIVDGADQGVTDGAVVERPRAVVRDQPVRARQLGIPDNRSNSGRLPVGRQEQAEAEGSQLREWLMFIGNPLVAMLLAVLFSFWSTLKRELVHRAGYRTRAEATAAIFEYVECWYNRKRRHSALGYLSPEEFEASLN